MGADGWPRRVLLVGAVLVAWPVHAQERGPGYSLYGTPGLVDMPTGFAAPDADLATTIGGFRGDLRTTLTFQVTPRISGSYRYAGLDENTYTPTLGRPSDRLVFDRSFDLRLLVLPETELRPAITVGLQDLAGTGKLSSEYIVASKQLTRVMDVTVGLGWGRLGSYNSIGSTGTRSQDTLGEGGVPSYDQWFRGDVALFGGIGLQLSERVRAELEYSSDAYADAVAGGELDRRTPWNAGLEYRFDGGTRLSVMALHGDKVAAQLTFVTNPKAAPLAGGREEAPLPVIRRTPEAIADTSWTEAPAPGIADALAAALGRDGLVFEGLDLSPRKATLRFENPRFGAPAQALGRAARSMARVLPASVEVFELVPVSDGLALSTVTLRRSDVEDFEFRDADAMNARVAVQDAAATARPIAETRYPAFSWSLEPYVQTGFFDPDRPIRLDLGVRARAAFRPTANTKIAGAVVKRIAGNLADTPADNSGDLPPVRTNFPSYLTDGDPGMEYLTAAVFSRPAPDIYARGTVGYLESMFGGVSAEVLWKPVDSRLGIGLELNRVRQRDFDRRFGFQDYEVTTGHLSAYYDFGTGIYGQIDAGRYLAGDEGATFTLAREFNNGWQVSAFATFTDASAEDFGEGSFDKGILLRIPTSWVAGQADRSSFNLDLRPIQRNGGARLNVRDRLYPKVRDFHRARVDDSFGRFWR
ncbi:YjbH domain-containing protein [Meridianimarinicoccus sp. RP-17]